MAEERLIIMESMYDEDILIEYSLDNKGNDIQTKILSPGKQWRVELIQGRIAATRSDFLHATARNTEPIEIFILPQNAFVKIFRQEPLSRITLGAMT
ncbi:MAG: hypothetical protein Q8R40_06770 [bacterium]|nr:hypothetical protein [bacterium]